MRPEAVASSDANLPRARLWLQSVSTVEFVGLFVFALGYLAAYGFGNFTQAKASPLWFPDSVLLCALLQAPRRKWWLYLAIAVPIRFIGPHAALPLWFICATTANDMVKATCAAYLLRRLPNGSSHPATMSQLTTFLGVAVLLVPALSAFAGAATRYLLGYGFLDVLVSVVSRRCARKRRPHPGAAVLVFKTFPNGKIGWSGVSGVERWLCAVSPGRTLASSLRVFAHCLLRSRSISDLGCDTIRVDWSLDVPFVNRSAGYRMARRKAPAVFNGVRIEQPPVRAGIPFCNLDSGPRIGRSD